MSDDAPIYDLLFSLAVGLSERFQALDPITLRRHRAREVFLLVARYNRYAALEKKKKKSNIIRRPAGDDWF